MISLYVHVPYCLHLCSYCDFYKKKLSTQTVERSGQWDQFEGFLKKNIENLKSLPQFPKNLQLQTLYFGGGTPSLWGERGANFWSDFCRQEGFDLSQCREWTLEVDPVSWSPEGLLAWKALGVTRFSVGLQSLHEPTFQLLDRGYPLERCFELLTFLQQKQWSFSVDFLLGIQFPEHPRPMVEELNKALSFGPNHVSLYGLLPPASYPHHQRLLDQDLAAEEYQLVHETLLANGFHHYEVSNFARPGFESQHNLKYWSLSEMLALGPSATGLLKGEGDQRFLRFRCAPSGKRDDEWLDEMMYRHEYVYLTLRKSTPWSIQDLFPWGLNLEQSEQVKNLLEQWVEAGFIEPKEEQFSMTMKGWLILDELVIYLIE